MQRLRREMQRRLKGVCEGGCNGGLSFPNLLCNLLRVPRRTLVTSPFASPSNPIRIQENMFYNNAKPQGDNDEYIHLIFLHNNLKKNTFLDAEHHVNHFSSHTCIFACFLTN